MSNIQSDDYYKILGVSKNADSNTIKKAYHKMAIKYHPDKNKDSSAVNIFKKINEAYSILSDENKRRSYDQFGKTGFNPGVNMNNGFGMHQAHNIFNQFFAGARNPNDPLQHFFRQTSFTRPSYRQSDRQSDRQSYMHSNNFHYHNNYHNNYHNTDSVNNMNAFLLTKGTRVLLHDLKKSSELNGEIGIIVGYSQYKERYIVSVNNTKIYLRIQNIQQIHDIKIINLEKNINLNGKNGKIIGYDINNKRYQVIINGDPLALKPNNILFKKDTLIKLHELKNDSKWNDKWAKIINYDNFSKKYLVKTESNKLLRVKGDNILA